MFAPSGGLENLSEKEPYLSILTGGTCCTLTIVYHYHSQVATVCVCLGKDRSESSASVLNLEHGKAVTVGCSPARIVLGAATKQNTHGNNTNSVGICS